MDHSEIVEGKILDDFTVLTITPALTTVENFVLCRAPDTVLTRSFLTTEENPTDLMLIPLRLNL